VFTDELVFSLLLVPPNLNPEKLPVATARTRTVLVIGLLVATTTVLILPELLFPEDEF